MRNVETARSPPHGRKSLRPTKLYKIILIKDPNILIPTCFGYSDHLFLMISGLRDIN